MTLPTWPASVPYEATSDWQMPQMFVAPIATDMDGGNQRLRSRPGANVATVNYPLAPLTAAQWTALETFFRTTLNNGASRFTMSVSTGGAYISKTVQLDGGKSPTVQRKGDFVNVVLPLRIFGL